ncbi:MAG TPA: hypothetical protein ENO30_04325 [Thermodesulfobium narugense]|nr:hypothetical protein [Thermodesulfobium narugense]
MTLQDYINELSNYVPTQSTILTPTLITAINQARKRIALESGCQTQIYSFNLKAGVNSYPYSSLTINNLPILNVIKAWVYIGTIRHPLERKRMGYNPLANIQSYPAYWWQELQTVYYYPTPADSYQAEWLVSTQIPQLVNMTDVETLPTIYHEAVKVCAARQVALADGNVQLAQVYDNDYKSLMFTLKNYRL